MILITRPGESGQNLYQKILSQGIETLYYAPILIQSVSYDIDSAQKIVDLADIILFISPNSVQFFTPLKINQQQVLAIGQSTATSLIRHHLPCHFVPKQENSEGLLNEFDLTLINGKKIVIVKGQGGRELLTNTLSKLGAQIEELVVYKRELNPIKMDFHIFTLIDSIYITSQDILQSLYKNCSADQIPLLKEKKLIVSSKRLATIGHELGFKYIIQLKDPHQQTLLDYLLASRQG